VEDIPNLPKALYKLAKEDFTLTTSEVIKAQHSADGATTKMLVKLQDGKLVESVIMRYGMVAFNNSFPQNTQHKKAVPKDSGGDDDEEIEGGDDMSDTSSVTSSKGGGKEKGAFRSNPRATLCLSSQVGCSMGCTFCATGTMGLTAHLTAGEILEQLYHANQITKIRNVVFMGMGEPLDNYTAVLSSIRGMTCVRRFSLGYEQISVSTVGVAPRIKQLADDAPKINLALSLHAPNQALRTEIVPSSKAWHIDKIMEALDYFNGKQQEQSRKPKNTLVEYVLIADVNDSEEVAHQLGQLLEGRTVVLNVIPYNPTAVPYDYKPPEQDVVDMFNKVVRSYGVRTIQRQELGQDIDGACGQLVVKNGGNGEVGETMGAPIPPRGGNGCGDADLEDMGGKGKPSSSLASGVTAGTVTIKGRRKKKKAGDSEACGKEGCEDGGCGDGDGDADDGEGYASAAVAAAAARATKDVDAAAAASANGSADAGGAAAAVAAKPAGGEAGTVDTFLILGALVALGLAFLFYRILPKLLQ